MINPVAQDRKYLMTYLSIWALVAGAHFAVFFFLLEQSFRVSVTDSFLFNSGFALIGLVMWYIVRYNDFKIKKLPELLLNHVAVMVILVASWILVNNFLLKSIFAEPEFHILLDDAISGRAVAGLFYYLTIVLVFYLIIYYQENSDQQIRTAKLASQLKDAELNLLKNQINPHFLFNSLNSISYLTLSDPEKAREIITKLSDFLRILLRENNQSMTRLKKELELTRLYIDIEKSRFGDNLIYQEKVHKNCYQAIVPSLFLLPLFENAVKHGVQNSTIPVTIAILVKKGEEHLDILVENNYESGSQNKGTGLGLKNIRERLNLIYQQQSVKITKTSDRFKVQMILPFNTDEK
ncbi:sensor histidine kinase [Bacteroidota bacterium]